MSWLAKVGTALCALAIAGSAGAATLPSLAQAYRGSFPVGIAVTPGQVRVDATANFIAGQFNIVVAENAMKPGLLNRGGPGDYTFANADAIVDFAQAHHMQVRGHALVWHQQMADWMFAGSGPDGRATKAELTERLRTYIHDVVGHFKGRVFAWDVVNEAFVPDEKVEQEAGWRASPWYRILGPEYIDLAFQFAHEADPDALLFYNDYSTESPRKRAMILALIEHLKAQGIAIDGIGHQSHYTIAEPASFAGLEQTLAAVAQAGLVNHITELDISLHRHINQTEADAATPALLKLQAARYEEIFRIAQRQHVAAVLMWGLHDEVSWLRNWPTRRFDAPLLFDGALQAKPAFWAVLRLAPHGKP